MSVCDRLEGFETFAYLYEFERYCCGRVGAIDIAAVVGKLRAYDGVNGNTTGLQDTRTLFALGFRAADFDLIIGCSRDVRAFTVELALELGRELGREALDIASKQVRSPANAVRESRPIHCVDYNWV